MATKTTQSTKSQHRTDQPPRYNVIMHNDDYTSMEFVVDLLQTVFRKKSNDANHIMLTIHTDGKAICGHYTFEIAETKIAQAHARATAAGFPLRCSMDLA